MVMFESVLEGSGSLLPTSKTSVEETFKERLKERRYLRAENNFPICWAPRGPRLESGAGEVHWPGRSLLCAERREHPVGRWNGAGNCPDMELASRKKDDSGVLG